MYTTKTSKNKTLLKANGNYKPYPLRGKANSKRKAASIRAYTNDPENAQEIKEKRIAKQVAFDKKKSAKISANWVPKDNSFYLEYITHDNQPRTLEPFGLELKVEEKRRLEQSKQSKAKFRAEQAVLREEYKPTGNKQSNPAFNEFGYAKVTRAQMVHLSKTIGKANYNKRSILHAIKRVQRLEAGTSKFQLRREMLNLNRAA